MPLVKASSDHTGVLMRFDSALEAIEGGKVLNKVVFAGCIYPVFHINKIFSI